MEDATGLFLGLVTLRSHRLNVLLKRRSTLLQNLDLLPSRCRVVVELVHLVVVQLDIAGKVGAPALVDSNFFPQLTVFHFELAYAVLD